MASSPRCVNDINLDRAQGRDGRGGRRIRQRQEHAGPRHHRAAAARSGRYPLPGQARCRRPWPQRSRDLLRRIQMIYQMPDVALNPRQTVGEIIGRPLGFYLGLDRRQDAGAGRGAAEGHRPPAGIRIALPRRALRRPEAARLHRPRAGRRARPHHLRRGDLGARSAGGRGHPQASRPAAARPTALPICSSPTISARCGASPTGSR